MGAKYLEISELLRQRIAAGQYADRALPGERALASEIGVGHMTARRAVQTLLEERWLERAENGRLRVCPQPSGQTRPKTYALAMPAFMSDSYRQVRIAIEQLVAEEQDAVLSEVGFYQWHDRSLLALFDTDFDVLFFLPAAEDISKVLRSLLMRNRHRVISVYRDLSESGEGLVSVNNSHREFVAVAIEHLVALGHDRIDCLNTQPGRSMQSPINVWRETLQRHGLRGELWDRPVASYGWADEQARQVAGPLLRDQRLAPAVFCTTLAAAIGLGRAAEDAGLRPGHDLAYATWDDPRLARLLIPSITTVQIPPLLPFAREALAYLAQIAGEGAPARMIAPTGMPTLLKGESTAASH